VKRWRRWGAAGGAVVLALTIVLSVHAVDDSVSAEDRQYLPEYLSGVAVPPDPRTGRRYDQEIEFIRATQAAVLHVAPINEGLPLNAPRELRDLAEAGRGLCYDRSRAIETILRYAHLNVRHIALYSTARTGSALRSLITSGVPSHAASEVQTARGWLVVDSNDPWISLDVNGDPVTMQTIQAAADGGAPPQWKRPPPNAIYTQRFTFVYGLYSRHGRFYPPYDFIPDVNYSELVENIW